MFESEHRLRHQAFFEVIASSEEGDAEWHAATAGLVVLRLVDAWIEEGRSVVSDDEWSMRTAEAAVQELRSREKLKTILSGILETLSSTTVVDLGVLAPRLMAYGQLLEYDARWALAADVYTTIAAHTHPIQEADVATQAQLRLGFCLRLLGDLSGSLAAYGAAGEIARTANDMVGMLRARIGEAKAAIARGNMPQATEILDETISRAREHRLDAVRSMALHDRSDIAFHAGDYEMAIRLAYDALGTSDSARARDRILADIAASFYKLGVHSAARDAYLILAATGQEQYQRWTATLNLMEIAAADGDELLFEQYRRSLDVRALPPQQVAMYWLQAGTGYDLLGKPAEARTFLERAISIAEEHELNRIVFEAERALADLGRVRPSQRAPQSTYIPDTDIASVASRLREERLEVGT